MSMNLHCEGDGYITLPNGEKKRDIREVYLYQTPTEVSYNLIKQDNVKEAYFDWVRSISEEEQVPIYAKDDIFSEGEIIGYRTVNYGEVHIEDVKQEIENIKEDGYEIQWEVW